jgi:Ca2+-transporting ATPase
VERTSVFARVSPEHKLRIVDALQGKGHVVAMTGDGVNDAPALKTADIGVAMGITGTDVSKEAASMVLRDDNFATIVAAVEEGRVIYDNLRRFVRFAVAGNIGKIMVMVLWPLLVIAIGHELGSGAEAVALLPLQLLWLNLMTDGLLGLSMGAELPESNVMQRKPNSAREGIFSGAIWQTTWIGLFIGVVALGVGLWYDYNGLPQWQTMMFNTLAFLQLFQAVGSRSARESVFTVGLFSNRVMNITAAAVILLQVVALYTPVLNTQFLRVVPLSWQDFLVSAGLGAALLVAMEIDKAIRRARRP